MIFYVKRFFSKKIMYSMKTEVNTKLLKFYEKVLINLIK